MPDIHWKLHLSSPPDQVFRLLSTDEGRNLYWTEKSIENDGYVTFHFINGMTYTGRILESVENEKYVIDYFHTTVTFTMLPDGQGGTDLIMDCAGVSPEGYTEMHPGWLSVLLALKAAADFGVDLRNHDPKRTWDQRYVDN